MKIIHTILIEIIKVNLFLPGMQYKFHKFRYLVDLFRFHNNVINSNGSGWTMYSCECQLLVPSQSHQLRVLSFYFHIGWVCGWLSYSVLEELCWRITMSQAFSEAVLLVVVIFWKWSSSLAISWGRSTDAGAKHANCAKEPPSSSWWSSNKS